MRKVAKEWNTLPEEKKNVYNEEARVESIQYRQDLATWELKMIRLGNLDLVRQDALIDSDAGKKEKLGRGRPRRSD